VVTALILKHRSLQAPALITVAETTVLLKTPMYYYLNQITKQANRMKICLRFNVLMAVNMMTVVFWVMMPYSLVGRVQP
jgi:hypothetical protein